MDSESENINNNPLIISLDNQANIQSNQNDKVESSREYPSPDSIDSTASPSQGASSTQESLSELSSGNRETSIDYPSTSSKQSTEQLLIEETLNQTDIKLESLGLMDSEKLKDSLARSDLIAQDSHPKLSNEEATSSYVGEQASSLKTPNCDNVDSSTTDADKNIYHVKWIEFGLRNCAIITQNENGPCPLISIINVLLLRGEMSLPNETEMVSAEQLLQYLGDHVLSQDSSNDKDPNQQRNLNDSIAVLPRLSTGLDVNVRFTGVGDFEFTPELLIFDVLNINLFHGWLVDPQSEDVGLAVAGYSYNQLVEKIITNRMSSDSVLYSQSLLAEQFLEESASQLTYHGLYELNSTIKDQTLAVFFRNNHFSTIFKKNGELFILVTDQGYLNQSDVVWETLANIEGDCHFLNHLFQTSGVDERLQGKDLPQDATDRDRYLAEALQREGEEVTQRESLFQMFKNKHFGDNREMSDEELAKKLQEVENRAAQERERREQEESDEGVPGPGPSTAPPQPQNPIGPRKNKNKDCTIL